MPAPRQIVIVGGMDPSGGAGLLRDAWTVAARAPELELHAVCTASTRQGDGRPARAAPARAGALAGELDRVMGLDRLAAVKLGMIPPAHVERVERWLAELRARPPERRPWIVCDPVGTATAGGRLGAPPAALLALAAEVDLLTPNADELAELAAAHASGHASGHAFGAALPSQVAVLHKGEAIAGRPELVRDRLCLPDGREHRFDRSRVPGPDPRGTGCALASAIASALASGHDLVAAVAGAIAWLDEARRDPVRVGHAWHLRPATRPRACPPG